MYRVIYDFMDLKDNNRIYHVGDTYVGDRFEELSGPDNKLGKPLIEAVGEPKPKRRRKKK